MDRPTRRAGPFAERVRVVAACSALALVGWQAVVAAEDVVSELSSRPLRHHRRALESTPDELIRLHLGKDHELYRALREHLPPDAKVLISFRDSREGYAVLRRRVTRLGALSYPITFRSWPYDAARPELDRPGKDARREFVLDLDSGRDYSVWPVCEELARGEGYRLLIVGSEAP